MTQVPVSFAIDDSKREYYNTKDLLEYKREFFYGCTGKPRKIIMKKNIDASDYVYANYTVKTGEWKLTDESCRKAQLLISKSWVDANYFKAKPDEKKKAALMKRRNLKASVTPENKVENKVEVEVEPEEEESLEMAPPLIILEDEEKFRDSDGNIYEIETRGEKTRKGIFFLVEDVKKCFELNKLDTVLMNNKKNSYERHIHYKCFIKNTYGSYKKCLYLTHNGMMKYIHRSRLIPDSTKYTIKKWLDNFDKSKLRSYRIRVPEKYERSRGYIYIISAPKVEFVKVGMWRSDLKSLENRYQTYYGKDLTIVAVFVQNCLEVERLFKTSFSKYNITNELYIPDYVDQYEEYIQKFAVEGNSIDPIQFDNSSEEEDPEEDHEEDREEERYTLDTKMHGLKMELAKANASQYLLLKYLENAKLREESLKREMELQRELAIQKQEAAARIHELEKRCYEMQIQLLSNK